VTEEPGGVEHTGSYRDDVFRDADLRGVVFRSCDMSGVKIVDALLGEIEISGDVERIVVNEVDVTSYVTEELDRRHPERGRLRAASSADDHREVWAMIEQMWDATMSRASELPEPLLGERVAGEWSFVETLRHLIFATDAWIGRTVLDDPMPYHAIGLTHTSYPPDAAAELGIDLDASPSLDEVLEIRTQRMATVRRVVDGLVDDGLDRRCRRNPAPGYPDEPPTVRDCLRVVMQEESYHHGYATRDLAVLEAR
jgi:hypothetical protein